MGLLNTLRFIARHPLNRGRRLRSLGRFASWQVMSRLAPGPFAVEWVDGTRLLVSRGQTGATGNLYTGLHELPEMAFVLHVLRPGDLFVDVGANVGSYTVLASAAAGASSIAFEPGRSAASALMANVSLNRIESRVEVNQAAVGDKAGSVSFTASEDTLNHVVENANGDAVTVPMTTVDESLAGRVPLVMKIDVEGYESHVLDGAPRTLADSRLLAVIMETNGSGSRYDSSDAGLHGRMIAFGFMPCTYDPFNRVIQQASLFNPDGNTIYVRDIEELRRRTASARRFRIPRRGAI